MYFSTSVAYKIFILKILNNLCVAVPIPNMHIDMVTYAFTKFWFITLYYIFL